MLTPIEQRKDLFEVSSDLNLMISYRKAILENIPRSWVYIHKNQQTNNYGLEVTTIHGNAYASEEADKIRQILSDCRKEISIPISVPTAKKSRKKKEIIPS
jgi:hypothetical protein